MSKDIKHLHANRAYLGFAAAWLAITVFALYLLLTAAITNTERVFELEANNIAHDIQQKLIASNAVLSGLVAFLEAVDESDERSATRYAAAAIAPYPHIYMLEVARQVPRAERKIFENAMRSALRPNFSIRDFAQISPSIDAVKTSSQSLWPIVFMHPALASAEEIYGVNLESVPHVAASLKIAQRTKKIIASPIFQLYEGDTAYILLQTVNRKPSSKPNIFGDGMVAMLLTKTEQLLPAKINSEHQIEAHWVDEHSGRESPLLFYAATPTSWIDRVLPRLSLDIDITHSSQKLNLHIARQIQWREILSYSVCMIASTLIIAMLLVGYGVHRHFLALKISQGEHQRAEYLATHDALTDLPNRLLLSDRVDQAINRWHRHGNEFALLAIDLDHFKGINDTHGHAAGDIVLVTTAKRITQNLRNLDTVARYGGDEFIVLIADILAPEDALAVGEKIRAMIEEPIPFEQLSLKITCSLGISICPRHGEDFHQLHRLADGAMYATKNTGRNGVKLASI